MIDRTIVGAFTGASVARAAAQALHEEGFHDTWIGITRADDTLTLDSADESLGAKIGRYFTGEGNGLTLFETLIARGVTPVDAQRVDASIEPSDVIITVHGSNQPELAAQIIEAFEGDVLAGAYRNDGRRLSIHDDVAGGDRRGLRDARLESGTIPTIGEAFFIETAHKPEARF